MTQWQATCATPSIRESFGVLLPASGPAYRFDGAASRQIPVGWHR